MKWLKTFLKNPKALESPTRFARSIQVLEGLNVERFEKVYSSDMALIQWPVMYGDIFTYVRHLNEAKEHLTYKYLDPSRYSHPEEYRYVSEFSLKRGFYSENIVETYGDLRHSLIQFLTHYESTQCDQNSIPTYNTMVLTKLVNNSFVLIDHLIQYPP